MKRSKFDLMVFMVPDFFKGMIRIPDIQRENTAWSVTQRQSLIDSLYNDFDIPKMYFRSKEEHPGIWWLIDGQQRLSTVRDFLEGKFTLSDANTLPPHTHHKHFYELENQDQDRISKRILDCVIIECTEEEEEDMFVRLNNGTPLSVSEKRNAIKGEFRDTVKALASHPFFLANKYNFSAKRFAVDVLCAQLCSMVMETQLSFASTAINKLYEANKDFPKRKTVEKIVKNLLDVLNATFLQKEKYLKKSTLITYAFLLFQLEKDEKLKKIAPSQLYAFFHGFEEEKEANNNRDAGSKDLDRKLLDYQILLNKGAYSPEALSQRVHLLRQRLEAFLAN